MAVVAYAIQNPAYSSTESLNSRERRLKYTWKARQEPTSDPSDPGPAGLPEPVRLLIQRRGLSGSFLSSPFSGLSHWKDLPGARAAADIIGDAVDARGRILVHGDFDADGITAAATALRALNHLAPGWMLTFPAGSPRATVWVVPVWKNASGMGLSSS